MHIKARICDIIITHRVNPNHGWERYKESIEIPSVFHFSNATLGCEDMPVTMLVAIYDGYGKFAPIRRSPS